MAQRALSLIVMILLGVTAARAETPLDAFAHFIQSAGDSIARATEPPPRPIRTAPLHAPLPNLRPGDASLTVDAGPAPAPPAAEPASPTIVAALTPSLPPSPAAPAARAVTAPVAAAAAPAAVAPSPPAPVVSSQLPAPAAPVAPAAAASGVGVATSTATAGSDVPPALAATPGPAVPAEVASLAAPPLATPSPATVAAPPAPAPVPTYHPRPAEPPEATVVVPATPLVPAVTPAKPTAVALATVAPAGPATGAKPAQVPAESTTSCAVALAAFGVKAAPAIAPSEGGCRVSSPVNLTAAGNIVLMPKALIDCATAATVAAWLQDTVAPKALADLGAPLTQVRILDSYNCRTVDNIAGANLSEHARGKAIDIGAFKVGDRWIVVGGKDTPEEQAFFDDVRKSACGPFTTVLGPGADQYHTDNLHLDTEERQTAGPSKGLYCE